MSAELHIGDLGTKLRATIYDGDDIANIGAATLQKYILHKPSVTQVELTTSFVTDGSDGQIEYVTTSDTLDEAGFYKLQAYIEIGAKHWHTDTVTFRVYPNLN